MLGWIIFVFVIWFIPLIAWYFIRGKYKFSQDATCINSAKEILQSKRLFYGALFFGLLIIAILIIFG